MATTNQNPEQDKNQKLNTPKNQTGTQQGGQGAGTVQGGQGGQSADNPREGRNSSHDKGNERSVAGREDS